MWGCTLYHKKIIMFISYYLACSYATKMNCCTFTSVIAILKFNNYSHNNNLLVTPTNQIMGNFSFVPRTLNPHYFSCYKVEGGVVFIAYFLISKSLLLTTDRE